jgi:hypothetical protein
MALVAAATLVAEIGDITRFANPRQLMAYLGLVPSEHSSGGTRRQGGITKAGNGAARRMLIEAAWSYRFPARISREQLLRQEGLAKPIRDTAWKAQERLCRRYRKLARAGKPPTVVTAAIARELAGFVWAIARQAQPSPPRMAALRPAPRATVITAIQPTVVGQWNAQSHRLISPPHAVPHERAGYLVGNSLTTTKTERRPAAAK